MFKNKVLARKKVIKLYNKSLFSIKCEIYKVIINHKHPKQLWRSKNVLTFFMHVKNAWLDTLTFYAPLWPGHEIKIGLFLLKCKQLTVRVVVSSSEFIAVFCNKCNYDHDRSLNSEQQDTGPMTERPTLLNTLGPINV